MRTGETTLIDVEISAGHESGRTIGYLGELVDIVVRNFNIASASGGTSLHVLDWVSCQINLEFGIFESD